MSDHTSRYYGLATATVTTPDGRNVSYLRRRFLPKGSSLTLLAEVTVSEGDRLDLIASRTLGDPAQAWRIADANNAMNPLELADEPGDVLRVPLPTAD